MALKNFFKNSGYVGLVIFTCLKLTNSLAQTATFEVGSGVIDAYNTGQFEQTDFTRITFDDQFVSPPNVFALTPEFDGADDPCTIRIENISTTGFDATCLEPINEDRVSPDIPFEYIAIQNGTTNIPLADGSGGSVEFRSACINNVTEQQRGGGSGSFRTVNFSPAFNNPPAIINQVVTTNNFTSDSTLNRFDNAFLDVAVSNVTASSFQVAIESAETRTTLLTSSEVICYLAVETNGCQSLDLSSFGGPTMPVEFQALQSAAVIAGHDNGACDSVSFENGCFSSTPSIFAKQTTRNGPDGGWLRRCSASDSAATFIYDEDRVNDFERSHTTEAISILAFGEIATTPVTLNSAKVSLRHRLARFEWETTAETFHLGFNLWGESSEGWVQLNRKLVASSGSDTDQVKSYRHKFWLTREQANEISNFGISSVDSTGHEEFYGPFKEGQPYGEDANNEPVDWTQTRNAFEQSMAERGFVKVNNRWVRLSSRSQAKLKNYQLGVNRSQFEINVESTGIHSISAAELLALNPQWRRQRLRNIALTLNGQALPRHIVSDDNRLDENDQIVFNALAPQGSDTPFVENYVYRLSIDRHNAVEASTFNGTAITTDSQLASAALFEKTLTSKKLHSAALTTGDPWYDTRLLSTGNTASVKYAVDFDKPIQEGREGELDVLLFGSLDFPGEGDDHHVRIYVNDRLISDLRFDGLTEQRLTLPIEAELLTQTGNEIRVDLVGDTGFFADVVLVDEIAISAFSALSQDIRPVLDFADLTDADGYQVSSQSASANQVYAYTTTGLLSSVETKKINGKTSFAKLPFEVGSDNEAKLRYAVGTPNDWAKPSSIRVVAGKDLHSKETDYLIVAHPTFIGDELNEFVEFKEALGYTVRVVDWLDIVDTYGYGNNTPAALNNFLSAANALYSTDNVLIVGGHTYDYFGITNDSIVNFVPSHYRPVSVFEYTATDNPYADLNGDNIPEIAIGRWPVRSITDLQTIIKKTKDWHQNRAEGSYQDAYLVAQATDDQNLDFTEQLDIRVQAPLSRIGDVENVSILSLDNVPEDVNDVVSFTRSSLSEQINGGVDIVSFSGHASPTAWGFQNIINTNFVKNLENQGEPVLLMPLACYITHYESVTTNTLAHQWLFAGDIGAAAIHGASVLGDYRENGLFAERYLRKSKVTNTLGQAILKAKKELGSKNEVLHNWSLLGDPALPVR